MEDSQQNHKQVNKVSPILIGGLGILVLIITGFVIMRGLGASPNDQITSTKSEESQNLTADSQKTSGNVIDQQVAQSNSVQTISVDAGSYYYNPSVIRVKKGQTVKIVLNAKDMMHDFNIDELGVRVPVTKAGETNNIEFVASKAGEFEYYCSVGEHRKLGQVGKLIIEE